MDCAHQIVLVGDKDSDQAVLRTQIKAIRLTENVGMAVTSIFHGQTFNITKKNNKIFIKKSVNFGSIVLSSLEYSPLDVISRIVGDGLIVEVPPGKYHTSDELLRSIKKVIDKKLKTEECFKVLRQGTGGKIRGGLKSVIVETNSIEIIRKLGSFPWLWVGVTQDFEDGTKLTLPIVEIPNTTTIGFLYANIVENSYINGKLSRNLTTIPLVSSKFGSSYYEFKNPIYIPIEIKQFVNIILEIRDLEGELISFAKGSQTVVTLHLKPIKGG